MKPGALTAERRKTHGEWADTAQIAGVLKDALHREIERANLKRLSASQPKIQPVQVEALDMILAKIARIVSGDPNHPDHWDDIAGYALLARGER